MVAKLEVMEAHLLNIEADGDPVKLFEHQRRYAHAAIVLGQVDGGQLVLDDGHQGGDQHELGDVAMYQEAPDHGCSVLMKQAGAALQAV